MSMIANPMLEISGTNTTNPLVDVEEEVRAEGTSCQHVHDISVKDDTDRAQDQHEARCNMVLYVCKHYSVIYTRINWNA